MKGDSSSQLFSLRRALFGCLPEHKDSIERRLFLLVLHVEILTFLGVFLTVPMETKQQKENFVRWHEGCFFFFSNTEI